MTRPSGSKAAWIAISGQSSTLDQAPFVLLPAMGLGPPGGTGSPGVGGAGGVPLSGGLGAGVGAVATGMDGVEGTGVAAAGEGAAGAGAPT